MIAQVLALTHPEMLRGLVLCSTTARMTPDADAVWDERIRIARTEGMQAHVETTISRWFTPAFVAEHPEVTDPIRAAIRNTDTKGYIGCIEAIRHTEFLDRLPEISVPTMVIAGGDDPGLPAAQAIQEHVRGSELVVLSPAAHLCNLQQPEAFNRALASFLARSESDGAGE
jgi:3-oxoadipate enol-lactonase